MTISELGSIGEFLGAIGVIVTLIYLALQIRGAKRIALAENVREVFASYRKIDMLLAADEELMRIWVKGLNGLENLNQMERSRFANILLEFVIVFRESQIAYQHNMLEDEDYEGWGKFVASLLNTPGGSAQWEASQIMFGQAVREKIEKLRVDQPDFLTLRRDLLLEKE